MAQPAPDWHPRHLDRSGLDAEALRSLLDGRSSMIVIDDFYSRGACRELLDVIHRVGLRRTFGGTSAPSQHGGLAAVDYKDRSEGAYLDDVDLARTERHDLLGELPDPTDAAIAALNDAWPSGATLATRGGRPYFAGVIRVLKEAPRHNDWMPRDIGPWLIDGIRHQLSWHLYLSAPDSGGEFSVWRPSRSRQDGEALTSDECLPATVAPAIGRFVLFETRNDHAFQNTTGECLVISSFLIATDEEHPLMIWS